MAGLPVLATPRVEMAALLSSTRSGFTTELDAQSLAATLNGVDFGELNQMRKAALTAAQSLNWRA